MNHVKVYSVQFATFHIQTKNYGSQYVAHDAEVERKEANISRELDTVSFLFFAYCFFPLP